MDVRLLIGIVILTIVSSGQIAFGQERISVHGQASATIIIPLSAREASMLNFGRFYPGNSGGTIVMGPDGSVNTTSTVVADVSGRNPGSYLIAGQADATVVVSLPDGPSILTGSDGVGSMEVSGWEILPADATKGIKLEGGVQTVMIGATLRVGSLKENPKGLYTGTYQVIFAYN